MVTVLKFLNSNPVEESTELQERAGLWTPALELLADSSARPSRGGGGEPYICSGQCQKGTGYNGTWAQESGTEWPLLSSVQMFWAISLLFWGPGCKPRLKCIQRCLSILQEDTGI